MRRASIGVSAHLGWAATCVLACDKQTLRILRTDRLETSPKRDREACEPYHVAGGFHGLSRVPKPANPKAALNRGLRKQQRLTARALDGLLHELAPLDRRLAFAGILMSRGRPAASFEKSIGSHTQIHIQEGLAVRASIARALGDVDVRIHEIDGRSLISIAAEVLGESERALMKHLDATHPENGGAWRKEEKLAALAAWIAWRKSVR